MAKKRKVIKVYNFHYKETDAKYWGRAFSIEVIHLVSVLIECVNEVTSLV